MTTRRRTTKMLVTVGAILACLVTSACGLVRIDASDYDQSCTEDADCRLVSTNCPASNCGCATDSLNVAAVDQFLADRDGSCIGVIPLDAECICFVAQAGCREGQCERLLCETDDDCEVL